MFSIKKNDNIYFFYNIYFLFIIYQVYAKVMCAVLNKSWNQHPTKKQVYGHLPPISQTI